LQTPLSQILSITVYGEPRWSAIRNFSLNDKTQWRSVDAYASIFSDQFRVVITLTFDLLIPKSSQLMFVPMHQNYEFGENSPSDL